MTALPRQHDLPYNSDPAVVSVTRFVVPVTFTNRFSENNCSG